MRKYLYVVEMWNDAMDRWEPTVGVGLWREMGRSELKEWRQRNVDDKFRLSAYRLAKTL